MSPTDSRFIDTNVFLRYLTNDLPEQSERAATVLEPLATGYESAWSSEIVLLEIEYVLRSTRTYSLAKADIVSRLKTIVGLPGLQFEHRGDLENAVACYESNNVDFADCLHIARMQRLGINQVVSFDSDFDKIAEITRVEP